MKRAWIVAGGFSVLGLLACHDPATNSAEPANTGDSDAAAADSGEPDGGALEGDGGVAADGGPTAGQQARAGAGGMGGGGPGGAGGTGRAGAGGASAGAGAGAGGAGGSAGAAAGSGGAHAGQGGSAGQPPHDDEDDHPGPDAGTGGVGGSPDPVEPHAGNGGNGGTGGSAGTAGAGGAGGAGGAAGAGGKGGSGAPINLDPTLTYLSELDRNEDVVVSPDGLSAEWLGLGNVGIRSTRAVQAHEGVFYFEVYADLDLFQAGVATAAASLTSGAGSSVNGFGIDTGGVVEVAQGDSQPFTRSSKGEYGFVVDYRGDHPTVHLLAGTSDAPRLVTSRSLSTVSVPLFIHLSGLRRKQGNQATINPGNDTTNQPFVFDARAVLQTNGLQDVASALVLGWGKTSAKLWNEPPAISLLTTPPSALNVGDSVTLTAAATDVEDGTLDAQIAWDVLSAGVGLQRVHATGGSFKFTPSVLGQHPIRVSVSDAGGKRTERTFTIKANGTLKQFSTVQLTAEPGLSGAGIQLSADGLSAHWTIDQKLAVRANQGLYGDFWYVEGHRLVPEDNQAIGLVIGGVSLNPYPFDITPPSCSINTTGPSVFHDLMYAQSSVAKNVEYYGMAVDYRGSFPVVHVIIGGKLATSLPLPDVTVPIYPMLYGNVNGYGAAYDMAINFGASAFHEDPVSVLRAAGVDPTGLKVCWGTASSGCR